MGNRTLTRLGWDHLALPSTQRARDQLDAFFLPSANGRKRRPSERKGALILAIGDRFFGLSASDIGSFVPWDCNETGPLV